MTEASGLSPVHAVGQQWASKSALTHLEEVAAYGQGSWQGRRWARRVPLRRRDGDKAPINSLPILCGFARVRAGAPTPTPTITTIGGFARVRARGPGAFAISISIGFAGVGAGSELPRARAWSGAGSRDGDLGDVCFNSRSKQPGEHIEVRAQLLLRLLDHLHTPRTRSSHANTVRYVPSCCFACSPSDVSPRKEGKAGIAPSGHAKYAGCSSRSAPLGGGALWPRLEAAFLDALSALLHDQCALNCVRQPLAGTPDAMQTSFPKCRGYGGACYCALAAPSHRKMESLAAFAMAKDD
eukprot:1152524-Pelagomonas_calceolata.AAC.5